VTRPWPNARAPLSLLRPELPALAVAFVCMAAWAATTAAMTSLVGPILGSLTLGRSVSLASGFLAAVRSATGGNSLFFPALLLAIGLLRGLSYFGHFYLMGLMGERVAGRLRLRVLTALVRAGPRFLTSQRSGDLLSRLSTDAAAVEFAVTYGLASILRDPLTAMVLLGVCVALDWRLALLAFGLLPLSIAFLAPAARRLRKLARGAQSGQGDLGHRLQEGLQGLSSIQVDGLEAREREQFQQLSQSTLAQQLSGARLRAASSSLMEVAAVLGVTAMLWVAEVWVAHGPMKAEHLFSFLASALVLTQQLKPLTKVGQFTASGEAAAQRLLEIEAAALGSIPGDATARPAARPLEREIRFEDVWFRYPERPTTGGPTPPEGQTLEGVNLTLRRGERLALVGESGAGKTTLVALLLGLHRPDRGRILFDGQPIDGFEPQSLHRQFSWVGQDASLFDATLGENISMGRPIEGERLEAAAGRASALDFIERSGGFQARLGQRGGKLSGGERQRIALARAFYWDAPLLLLDEPTSQLDARNEQQIGEAIDGLMEGRTVLLVAHRLATIRRCDRVAVLRSGRVVEEGPPEELIARQGVLWRLVAAQSSLGNLPSKT
jgi:ATP-binding cassette, subfamily B, bacterial MsbA